MNIDGERKPTGTETRTEVNIRLKTSLLCDTWQLDLHLDRYFVDPAHKTYQ